jgi:phage terminase large subunit-like protein
MSDDLLGPKSLKQEMFLNNDADIVVFGGAAGAGKSFLGVMAMLKWHHLPKFRGVMMRRVMPQITGPGGIWETGQEMYQPFGVTTRTKDVKFVFPSGATIVARGCEQEKDKYNLQGWQVSAFLLDEMQQFEESQVVYFISRMRTDAGMQPQMLGTCNPLYESFLRKWLENAGYLDEEGIPLESMAGVKTWFIRIGNDMVWRKTKQELLDQYGEHCGPMSFAFIPAKCTDNPVLMERDPTYLSKLQSLPRVERARLLDGSWYAKEESSSLFQRDWVKEVDFPQQKRCTRVRAWDLACSLVSENNISPDYTASVLMSRSEDGEYTIEDVVRFRGRHGDVMKLIIETSKRDGDGVTQYIPKDPGVGGSAYCEEIIKTLVSNNITAKAMPVAGRGGKIQRFGPFSAACQANMVSMVKGCTNDLENKIMANNEVFYDELERVDPANTRVGHNDMFDACADAFEAANKVKYIPAFAVPIYTKSNEFSL